MSPEACCSPAAACKERNSGTTGASMCGDDAIDKMEAADSVAHISRLEQVNAQLQAECESLAGELARVRAQNSELRGELEFESRRLGDVLRSRSWRLGRPLRVLGSMFRTIRARSGRCVFTEAPTQYSTQVDHRVERALGALIHYPTPRAFRVLFLNGVPCDSHAARYRINHFREALALSGIHSEVTTEPQLVGDSALLLTHDLLVIFRACWSAGLNKIVGRCHRWEIPVIWDSDDYIFEPEIVTPQYIDALRRLPPAEARLYLKGVHGYRKSLLAADYFTGSTEFLTERAAELGKRSYVIRNFLSGRLLELSAQARSRSNDHRADGVVRIVFMSGTPTHQRDFGCIAPVIARILKERSKARLVIIGHVDVSEFPCLEEVAGQVRERPAVPWEDLPELVGDCDICVAPLDILSPYCQAKSDLKFIEGAAYGLAVVASATAPYRRHIDHGRTGFVCETSDEWYRALIRLIDDEEMRKMTVLNGVQEVIERRAVKYGSRESTAAYRKIIHDFRMRKGVDERSLVIRWIVTPVKAGSGGHEAVYVAAQQMSLRGHLVTLHFMEGEPFGAADTLRVIRAQLGYDPLFQAVVGTDQIRSCDALIATQNTTAAIVNRFKKYCCLPAYFVQDFEPYFYPVGTEYFAAEQTYHYDFFCITVGRWLADLMRVKYGRRARHLDFWVDRNFYHPPSEPLQAGDGMKVVFFVRPDMPRRCFGLGLLALFHLHRMMPEAEIVLFGAQEVPVPFDFPFRSLGALPKEQLGDLYRSARVGLAFSTTNPSLVPFEMMACGLPVVDLDVLESRLRHGADYPALLVQPDPQSLAEAMEEILTNGTRHAELSMRAMKFTSRLPSREEALKQVAVHIEREIGITWSEEGPQVAQGLERR